MTINPKWSFWLNMALSMVNGFVGIAWATYLNAGSAAEISFSLLITQTLLNAVLHGLSGAQSGPIAKAFAPTQGS